MLPNYPCKCKKKKCSNPLCQVPKSTLKYHRIACSTPEDHRVLRVFQNMQSMQSKSTTLHEQNSFPELPKLHMHFCFNNIGRASWSAFLTSVLKDHLHVGLFRPIRLQHRRMMTTSFTCSSGLGDKLMPPLLPGMFWLLFARLQRELCVRWWRVALKHHEEPSHHLYSQQRGDRCARWPFEELCQDRGRGVALPLQRVSVKLPSVILVISISFGLVEHFDKIQHCFASEFDFELAVLKSFSNRCRNTLKPILLKSSSGQLCTLAYHANSQYTLKISPLLWC